MPLLTWVIVVVEGDVEQRLMESHTAISTSTSGYLPPLYLTWVVMVVEGDVGQRPVEASAAELGVAPHERPPGHGVASGIGMGEEKA